MKNANEAQLKATEKGSPASVNVPQLSIERAKDGSFRVSAHGWLAVVAVVVITLIVRWFA